MEFHVELREFENYAEYCCHSFVIDVPDRCSVDYLCERFVRGRRFHLLPSIVFRYILFSSLSHLGKISRSTCRRRILLVYLRVYFRLNVTSARSSLDLLSLRPFEALPALNSAVPSTRFLTYPPLWVILLFSFPSVGCLLYDVGLFCRINCFEGHVVSLAVPDKFISRSKCCASRCYCCNYDDCVINSTCDFIHSSIHSFSPSIHSSIYSFSPSIPRSSSELLIAMTTKAADWLNPVRLFIRAARYYSVLSHHKMPTVGRQAQAGSNDANENSQVPATVVVVAKSR